MNRNKQSNASLAELEHLNQLVKSPNPLSDRKVMIPITSKAFFEGTLLPSTRKGTDQGSDVEKSEQLMVNLGQGYLADMTRDEASKFIERKMKSLRLQSTGNPEIKKDSIQGKSLKMKKGFLQSKTPSKKKSTRSAPSVEDSSKSQMRPHSMMMENLPFIEIREEFDKEGNELKAEAIDISKQLHNVRQEITSKKGTSTANNEVLDTLLDSVPESTDMDAAIDSNYTDSSTETTEEVKIPYKELSTRLDELILLEENELKNKNLNAKSSKRLQGKGWAKGFLSNTKTAKKKVSSRITAPTQKQTTSKPDQTHIAGDLSRGKKVKFHKSNEVKEIPRIGTRSIESVKPSSNAAYTSEETSTSSFRNDMLRNVEQDRSMARSKPTKSIEVGSVMERNGNLIKNKISKPIPSNSGLSNEVMKTEPKRKLSKFAQRRLEERS